MQEMRDARAHVYVCMCVCVCACVRVFTWARAESPTQKIFSLHSLLSRQRSTRAQHRLRALMRESISLFLMCLMSHEVKKWNTWYNYGRDAQIHTSIMMYYVRVRERYMYCVHTS